MILEPLFVAGSGMAGNPCEGCMSIRRQGHKPAKIDLNVFPPTGYNPAYILGKSLV